MNSSTGPQLCHKLRTPTGNLTRNTYTWNQVTYIRQNRRAPQPILPTPQSGKLEPCWKCGNASHLICKMCKKQEHFSSMCKAPMRERRRQTQQNTSNTQNSYQSSFKPRLGSNQARRVRHIKDNTVQTGAQNSDGESEEADKVDAEAALYIKELTEEWANVNQKHSRRRKTQS